VKQTMKSYQTLLSSTRAAGLIEYGILAGLISVVSIATVASLGQQVDDTFDITTAALSSVTSTQAIVAADMTGSSCHDIYTQGGREDGIYTISTGAGDLRAACHFEDSGPLAGGWTVVALQSEGSAVDWNAGIGSNRADSSYFDGSFALSSAQIPSHAAFAVGRYDGGALEVLEGVLGNYSTGNIAMSGAGLVAGAGSTFDIHRNASSYYNYHDTEEVSGNDPGWNNTLTFDETSAAVHEHTWAFSPNAGPNQQGYAYDGVNYETQSNAFKWAVFVR
jgi:Flp pilus assembly pilin Flp